jgi:hypothetical protein
MHTGWTKYILRNVFAPILPAEIVWRVPKLGFLPPQKTWLANPRVNEMINDSISLLKKNQIINSVNKNKNWQYLMAAKLIEFASK